MYLLQQGASQLVSPSDTPLIFAIPGRMGISFNLSQTSLSIPFWHMFTLVQNDMVDHEWER